MALRVAFIGAGWIAGIHLEALARLGRTELVGVVSGSPVRAGETAGRWGGVAYDDPDRMLDDASPDVVYVCVPPHHAIEMCERLIARGIPFLTEKPLAATDPDGPIRVAEAIARGGLVVAVGYHLRGLEVLPEMRHRFASRPPRMVVARWLGSTPPPPWWGRVDEGGGQVVEQATHLYDLSRHLLGEAVVLGAVSTRDAAASPPAIDVVDATAALLRFDGGAIGSFANTRRLASNDIEIEFVSDDLLTTLRPQPDRGHGGWQATFDDGAIVATVPAGRDPYEVQAEAFLDAVEAGESKRVLSTYADALRTDRLTRAVVAATGAAG
jgi:myo-inositol 2-dehydrogenase / D-chiro-inositol 1-dehydrogenase